MLGKVAKAHHGVEGGADEEDHDGVEEDVAVDDGEAGVEGEEHAGQGRGGEASCHLPHGEETQGKSQNLIGHKKVNSWKSSSIKDIIKKDRSTKKDITVQHYGRDDEEDPNRSASKTHSQNGREIFEGVAWRREVETRVVTRYLACVSLIRKKPCLCLTDQKKTFSVFN